MARTFIGLGSNLGRRRNNILSAWNRLTSLNNNHAEGISSPYLSQPVGIDSDNWFINAVGVMETELSPALLLAAMLGLETDMGRDRSLGDDRTIDLDLLYYDDFILEDENLLLPHPAIAERLFVLLPLNEVAPGHIHPVSGKSSVEMLRELDSTEIVRKTSWDWDPK